MEDKLLIRMYKVDFGDCIYVRVPDKDDFYHILIDCGTTGAAEPMLKEVLDDVFTMLPDVKDSGKVKKKKRLDLLVATHPHADHIKGFNPAWFKNIMIRHIWLSAFMNENHPQAERAFALQAMTDRAAKSFMGQGLQLRPGVNNLVINSIWNPGAIKALRETLPKANKIAPLYVCRNIASKLTAAERKKHKIFFKDGTTCLQDFKETSTCMRVLAPEFDIDGYYLGKEAVPADHQSHYTFFDKTPSKGSGKSIVGPGPKIRNISIRDFRMLRKRLFHSAMAFFQADDALKNNTSIVMMLEWRGRRLLFAGDAEWKGKAVKKGRHNGCWDVMLKKDEKRGHLAKPIDFLKVGHHGSINGTPFIDTGGTEQPILDKLLPKQGSAHVVVSTLAGEHGAKNEVPYLPLMEELAHRAVNACQYPDLPGIKQPQRTDKEAPYIDITF